MIPREVIEEILSRTDIEQLISGYVTLQRAGNNRKGLCPFHSEKTPSFTVFPSEGNFYCFGCGVGGDAITFIRRAENLDYVDAVGFLAKSAGITIPEDTDARETGKPRIDKKRIFEMNRVAARFFHSCLSANTPNARSAYEYLHGKRGLADATINHFGLGFAPNEYGIFQKYMFSQGYTKEELVAGNLCGMDANTGRLYDSFFNRVMFPIIDLTGNVIAFGGRVTDNSLPKYKNSSDTPVYNKRRNLFALNFAKADCAEELILCEGYMDVISLHEAGFTNAVATLGTAITPEHARLMKKYTKRVVISYDMDQAGRNAAEKAMRLLEEVGLEVRLLKLKDAKDPDEFIKKFGKEPFKNALTASDSKFDYRMQRILSGYVLTVPQEKINAAHDLCVMISETYSAAERDVYIRTVAGILGMDASAIKSDVERIRRSRVRQETRKTTDSMKQATLGFSDRVNPDYVKMPAVARAEESVLGLLLLHPDELIPKVRDNPALLAKDDFLTAFNARVFDAVMNSDGGIIDTSDFSPDEVGRITRMKVDRMGLSDNSEATFRDCVDALKKAADKQKNAGNIATIDDLNALIQKKLQGKK